MRPQSPGEPLSPEGHRHPSEPEWPSGWEKSSGAARLLIFVGNLGVAVLFAVASVASFWHGSATSGGGWLFGVFANLVLALAVLGWARIFPAHRGRARVWLATVRSTGESAVVIGSAPAQRPFSLFFAVVCLGAGFFLLLAGVVRASWFVCVLGVLVVMVALVLVRWAYRGKKLWLTAHGVLWGGRDIVDAASWDSIWSVEAEEEGVYQAPSRRLIRLWTRSQDNDYPAKLPELTQGSSSPRPGLRPAHLTVQPYSPRYFPRLDVSWFACDPVLLFFCLDFYRINSDPRSELGTEAALERVRAHTRRS